MKNCPVIFGQVTDGQTDRQTDRLQTEYDAYEPTVRGAQVGSKTYGRGEGVQAGVIPEIQYFLKE